MMHSGLFIGNWHGRDSDASFAARAARDKASEARRETEGLEERLDRLALLCEALWTLVRDHTGLTDEQLRERVRDVDLSDGRLDGKVRRVVVECSSCGRAVSDRHRRCIYCGTETQREPFAGT